MVTSLELRGVQEISLLDPQLRRGMIVTASIGDPTRLDVNAIAVNSQQVTRNLIARAHRAGLEVFVWKVNDPALMLTMIHMGVDNIFTSHPELLIEVIEERERLSETEQTLLYVADFLAGRL